MFEDLKWLGISWQEGPDVGGPVGPYQQSQRRGFYVDAWQELLNRGFIYPCTCSRKDLAQAAQAPHEGVGSNAALDDEPIYPGTCRTNLASGAGPGAANWRFRVPDEEVIRFKDLNFGPQEFTAGSDFGDFVIWRRDDVPAYQLAVVVDDAAMKITEVVRGADLLRSTARQILLQRALKYPQSSYYHCPLVTDDSGLRLAKRHDALSLRALRAGGADPLELRSRW
jgi:glutamyl-tRNA synthetase